MNTFRYFLAGLLFAGCVSEARDNPLDGKIDDDAAPPPEITSIAPQKGYPGTGVTLKGKHFGGTLAVVSFAESLISPATRSETELTFVVPATAAAGVAEVVLTVDGQAAEAVTFAVQPAVTGLSRAAGYAGMTLVVTGATFGDVQGASKVLFGSVAGEVRAWSDSEITVEVPVLQASQTSGPPGGGGATQTQPASDVSVVVNAVASDPAEFTMFSAVPGARCALPCNTFGGVSDMARTGMPDPRQYHTAVWSGTQLIVWGGQIAEPLRAGTECTSSGARYAPATDTWVPVAAAGPAARCKHFAVWLGNRMFVAGGETDTGSHAAAPGSYDYDPAADSFTSRGDPGAVFATDYAVAATTDTLLLVWGGGACPGRIYDRTNHTWAAFPNAAPKCLTAPGAAGDGTNLWVWGGTYAGAATNSGYKYDSAGGTWSTLPLAGAPSPRTGAAVVYAGGRLVVYGGGKDTLYYSDGADYTVAGGWRSVSGAVAMGLKLYGLAAYGGTKALVIAQSQGTGYSGFLYDPADQSVSSWNNGLGSFTPQKLAAPVLMGGELAVFGGLPFSVP